MKQQLLQCWYLFWGTLLNNRQWQYKGQGYTDIQARSKVHRDLLTWSDKLRILKRDKNTCKNAFCGRKWPFAKMEVDHMYPLFRGGTNSDANLQCLCARCNKRKGTLTMREFLIKEVERLYV